MTGPGEDAPARQTPLLLILVALFAFAGCHRNSHPDSNPVVEVNKPRPTNIMDEFQTNRASRE